MINKSEENIDVKEEKRIRFARSICKECRIERIFYEPVVELILIKLWSYWEADKYFFGDIDFRDLFLLCPKCFEARYRRDLINTYYHSEVLGLPTLYRFLLNCIKYSDGLKSLISEYSRDLGFSFSEMMNMIKNVYVLVNGKLINENEYF